MNGLTNSELSRRTLLRRGAVLSTLGIVSPAQWDRVTAIPDAVADEIVVEQPGSDPFTIAPLTTNQSVESFFDYHGANIYSADTGLEREGVSQLFFLDGASGRSLVVIHDHPRDGKGGEAIFDFDGLPESGSWVVEDDPETASSDTYSRERVTWGWAPERTDGGAYRGGLDDGFEIEIDAAFDGIDTWQVLSGDVDDPDRIELDVNEPVTIRIGTADKERPSDEGLDSLDIRTSDLRLSAGERGSRSFIVDDTETLFHELFALESGGEVVTSYDEDVKVTQEFEAIDPPLHIYESRLEIPIADTTLEVQRTVHVELYSPRISVEYEIKPTEDDTSLDLTLYTAADFDVGTPLDDRGSYHEDGDFVYVTNADEEALTVGLAADVPPDEHDLRAYPAYEAVENGDLGDVDVFPESGESGDAVALLGFHLGQLVSPDRSRRYTSTSFTREVRIGAADTVDELWDVLDRRVNVSFRDARLAQAVENTRLVDPTATPEVQRTFDDPPMIVDKRTVPLFDLDVENLDVMGRADEVELIVQTLANSSNHPGRIEVDRFSTMLSRADLGRFEASSDPFRALEDTLPSFELGDELTAIRVRLGEDNYLVNGDVVTLDRGGDFETEPMNPLRIGFVPLDEPDGSSLIGNRQDFLEEYESVVQEATELIEQMYPVPEVRGYMYPDFVESSDNDDGDCAILEDALDSKDVLEDETPIRRSDTVRELGSIGEFDATIAITPDDYLDHHGRDAGGLHLGDIEAAALSEIDNGADTVAHEFGHHFSGDLYEEPEEHELAQRDDGNVDAYLQENRRRVGVDYAHARDTSSNHDPKTPVDEPGLLCRKVQVNHDRLEEIDDEADPLMSYGSNKWIDGVQYNDMIAHDLEPHPREDNVRMEDAKRVVNTTYCAVRGIFDVAESVSIERNERTKVHDEGDVTIEVLDAQGTEISTHTAQDHTEITAHGSDDGGSLHAVNVSVPFPPEAVYLRLTYEGETNTTNVLAESLREAVRALPVDAFERAGEQRKRALLNKLDAVESKVDEGAYRGAANQLRNDVRKRVDQWIRDDWAGTTKAPSQSALLDLVDTRVSDVEALEEANETDEEVGNGGDDGETDSNADDGES